MRSGLRFEGGEHVTDRPGPRLGFVDAGQAGGLGA
jgi:hypothetical protein